MATEPLATVIVLTYKRFDNLEKNINSILIQSYKNIEIVISDDGSENFDLDKIRTLFKGEINYGFKILHSDTNLGTVRNFTKAVKCSKGEYIIPLSQDDCFANSTVIEDIVSFFEKNGCDFVTAKRKGARTGMIWPSQNDSLLLHDKSEMLVARLLISNFISGSCLYYKRKALISNGLFDLDFIFLEDYPFILKIILQGKVIEYIDRVVIIYGERGVSNKGNKTNILYKQDCLKVIEKFILPNLDLVRSKLGRRLILCNYELLNSTTLKKALIAIKYFDLTVIKLYMLVSRSDISTIFHKLLLPLLDKKE